MPETKEEIYKPKERVYVHIGIGPHWVKCGHVFGSNYTLLGEDDIMVDNIKEARCVVCGKKADAEECCARNY